jgi:uncharacterized membrane protein YkoI
MGMKARRSVIAIVGVAGLGIGAVGLADAASTAKHKTVRHAGLAPGTAGNPAETVLTGSALQSASSAATAAVPGGTVERASIEDPKDASGAAYEVHLRKTDGSQVEVLEDASFKVLSVTAGRGAGHPGGGPGHRGGNPNEAPLTGATLKSATDAALAAVPGGMVRGGTAEDKNDKSGAAYEVHVTKTDGTEVVVLEDSAFKVLSVTADAHPGGGPGGPGHGFGRGGPGGPDGIH